MEQFSVLLVDSDRDFLDTLVERLRMRQIKVDGVYSGEAALEYIDKKKVDVVVLEVRMPETDGIEILKEVKKRNPLIEIIMLTGHANMEVAIESMELGAFDYLLKPMEIDALLYKIQDACQKKFIQEKKIECREKAMGKCIVENDSD
ncbi:MAG: response regulator [Desulfobacterales bacterium]